MTTLHLLRLPFDGRALTALGVAQGHVGDRFAVDSGYLVHAGLKAVLGEAAPKPFLIEHEDRDPLPVLAYGSRSLAELRRLAEAGEHARLVRWEAAVERELPLPLAPGRRLGFTVTACPTVCIARGVGAFDPGSEQDAYVAWLRRQGFPDERRRDPEERARVYLDWLAARLGPAARIETARLAALRGVRLWRKGGPSRPRALSYGRAGFDRARGRGGILDRRSVTFAGVLTVEDSAAFTALLARGVGRHRAFGFGMLLLRPAGAA